MKMDSLKKPEMQSSSVGHLFFCCQKQKFGSIKSLRGPNSDCDAERTPQSEEPSPNSIRHLCRIVQEPRSVTRKGLRGINNPLTFPTKARQKLCWADFFPPYLISSS
ncbi:hypothetical protein CDAR_527601 [Caerostris darwini]|uniref:Uncharacterized protein n=1 Tax=Caerostris darwini TaxID=1538125 RepID=A0AAV4RE76_9ARAC|nr:hypothetical protein CDAR_527601 [Caerostris darwini]